VCSMNKSRLFGWINTISIMKIGKKGCTYTASVNYLFLLDSYLDNSNKSMSCLFEH